MRPRPRRASAHEHPTLERARAVRLLPLSSTLPLRQHPLHRATARRSLNVSAMLLPRPNTTRASPRPPATPSSVGGSYPFNPFNRDAARPLTFRRPSASPGRSEA